MAHWQVFLSFAKFLASDLMASVTEQNTLESSFKKVINLRVLKGGESVCNLPKFQTKFMHLNNLFVFHLT